MSREPYRLLDLFSGIGGFSLGLERSGGFRTVAFCEIEPYCRRVLAKHWPGVPCYDDIRTLTAERLAADGIGVDAICGGWPCQDISLAGNRLGINLGERSSLIWETMRLVTELRPKALILENVAAFVSSATMAVEHSVHCVCGWSNRWRGLPFADREDERGMRAEELFVPAGRGNGEQGGRSASPLPIEIRRYASPAGGEVGAAPILHRLEHAHDGSIADPDGDLAALDREEGTVPAFNSCMPADFGEAAGVRGQSGDPLGIDEATQSAWFDGDAAAWLDCPVCGRGLDQPARRFVRTHGLGEVLGALAALGYHAEWTRISAADLGAPHVRARFWLVAHPDGQRFPIPWAISSREDGIQGGRMPPASAWWASEPSLDRVVHGVPKRVDRIRSLGNSLIPQIPELIGRAILSAEDAA